MNRLRIGVCLLMAGAAGWAQWGGVEVRGEITGRAAGGAVELRSPTTGPWFRCEIDFTGRFEARGVQPGDYELRVFDPAGTLLKAERVSVGDGNAVLRIDVPEARAERPPVGTVSVERLRNPVSGKARREFNRGVEASARGQLARAMAHLRRAIELHPSYFEALNNLGACHLRLKQYRAAAEVLSAAAQIAPGEGRIRANLAAALAGSGRRAEAESAARDALALEPDADIARQVLAYLNATRPRL